MASCCCRSIACLLGLLLLLRIYDIWRRCSLNSPRQKVWICTLSSVGLCHVLPTTLETCLARFASVESASNLTGVYRDLLSKLERHFVLNRKRVLGAMHQIFDCFVYSALPASLSLPLPLPWAGAGGANNMGIRNFPVKGSGKVHLT